MLERLLIDKMENRILVGTVMFLGIMLLVGWVAINEGARMASFENQFEARSIERGALLFNTNCTSCHGIDGLGGLAPALNNPHLFSHDYFANINRQIAEIQPAYAVLEAQVTALEEEREELNTEAIDAETTDERFDEIQARLDEITTLLGEDGDIATQMAELQEQLTPLYQERLAIADQLQPAVDSDYPLQISADGSELIYEPSRLAQMGFASTLEDYIFTTLVHGRPGSGSVWNGTAMVSWSQLGGGTLRTDQLNDLVAFITNWDREWTIDDALMVNQYGILYGGSGEETSGPPLSETHPGMDYDTVQSIVASFATLETPPDPVNGEALYNRRTLNCAGCHVAGQVAPPTAGTWDRVVNERLGESEFAGYTAEEYLVESIINPAVYTVNDYPGQMPQNFAELLTLQEIADIVAYLETQTEAE